MANNILFKDIYQVTSRRHEQSLLPGQFFDIFEAFNYIVVDAGDDVVFLINGQPPEISYPTQMGFKIPSWEGIRFIRVKNNNAGPGAQPVAVYYGLGDLIDNRTSGQVTISVAPGGPGIPQAKPTSSNTAAVSVDGGANAVILRAANPDRYSFSIEAGNSDLYIGSTKAEAEARGYKILGGATYVGESTDDFWAIRDAGAAADDAFTREEVF